MTIERIGLSVELWLVLGRRSHITDARGFSMEETGPLVMVYAGKGIRAPPQLAVQLEQRAAQRSNVDHRPSVRRSDAGGRSAITFLRPRAEHPQICSTHGALVRAIGDALGAQGTALGLGFNLWLTPEQSHFSPFRGRPVIFPVSPAILRG
jgi:hypothetical protein